MFTWKRTRSLTVPALCLLLLACNGNDARKCKIRALSNGDVRMVCPGGRTILLPAGKDSVSVFDDCEGSVDGNVVGLTCGDADVELGACGLGFHGNLLVGASSHPDFMPWPDFNEVENAANLSRFNELGCTRLLGNLVVEGGSNPSNQPILERLIYADTISFLGWSGELRLPFLRAAHVDLGVFEGQVVELPLLYRGGLSISGGRLNETLTLPAFREGIVSLSDVEGIHALNLPAMRSGDVSLTALPDLEFLTVPTLEWAGMIQLVDVARIGKLSLPALKSADFFLITENETLRAVSAPALEQVQSAIEIMRSEQLQDLALPSLNRVARLSITESGLLARVELPELRSARAVRIEQLPALSQLNLPQLAVVSEALHIEESGDSSGINFGSPELTHVDLISLDGSQFVEFKAPKLKYTGYTPIHFLDARFLRIVDLSALEQTELVIETSDQAPQDPLFIKITGFYHTGETPSSGGALWPIRFSITQGQPVDIDFSRAVVSVAMLVEVRNPREGWDFHDGFSGAVSLLNIPLARNILFRRATNLRELYVENVGEGFSVLEGIIGSTNLRRADVLTSNLQVFRAGVADDAEVNITNSAATQVMIEGLPSAFPTLTIRHAATNAGEMFSRVGSESLEAIDFVMETPSSGDQIDFNRVRRGNISIESNSVQTVSFTSLSEGRFELDSASILPGQILVPTWSSPGLVGQILANWTEQTCPLSILDAWPNVSLDLTNCE